MAAHVYKTKWLFLILEDEPNARELLKNNFTCLLGKACQVDFAASICQAVQKVKAQMQSGLPYDVFWVDLVLDYFSYENAHGEIVSAKSLSEIIDTERLRQNLRLGGLSPFSLATALGLQISPMHKNLEAYSIDEKLQLLEKSLAFSLPEAKACLETLVGLLQHYLQNDHGYLEGIPAENVYARRVLNFLFRQFSAWVGSQEKKFSLCDDDFQKLYAPEIDEMALRDAEKSAQSWTIFRDWVREFYHSVAQAHRYYQSYTTANSLLVEINKVAPQDYPIFLVNSFYAGERERMLETGAVYPYHDTIVAELEFKGTSKDTTLVKYLAQICARLRNPYLLLQNKRRGPTPFIFNGKNPDPDGLRTAKWNPNEIVITSEDYRLELTAHSFFPEFGESFYHVHDASQQFLETIREQALLSFKATLQLRTPAEIKQITLIIPLAFFLENRPVGKFLLHLKTTDGHEKQVNLSFDEGRWLFFELGCRRWFPKTFFVHSSWASHQIVGGHDYFIAANELMARAVKHAALDHPTLFPSAEKVATQQFDLPETAGFYAQDTDYISAFEWSPFVAKLCPVNLKSTGYSEDNLTTRQTLILLAICRELVVELKLRKIASHLLNPKPLTPLGLLEKLETASFVAVDETLQRLTKIVEKADARIIRDEYLPAAKNFIAVMLCFYSLPAPPVEQFYRFWRQKNIPNNKIRPIEKFVNIEKLAGLNLKKSLDLPATAEGKNTFLYVPAAMPPDTLEILTTDRSGKRIRFSDMTHQEFVEFIGNPGL